MNRSCYVSAGCCGNAVSFSETVSGTISLESRGIQALRLLSNLCLCMFKSNFAALGPCPEAGNSPVFFFYESKYMCVKWGLSSTPPMIISDWDQ